MFDKFLSFRNSTNSGCMMRSLFTSSVDRSRGVRKKFQTGAQVEEQPDAVRVRRMHRKEFMAMPPLWPGEWTVPG
jgi:hypothetical protein